MTTTASPAISIVIPSYRRSDLLEQCLGALVGWMRECDEALVVLRIGDAASWDVISRVGATCGDARLRAVAVDKAGYWPALMVGLGAADNEIVAFLDDDAIPMPGWVGRLADAFRDPRLGGCGGPILNFDGVRTANRFSSGGPMARVDWLGVPRSQLHAWSATRLVQDVDFLPGSNMAFRRDLLTNLRDLSLPGMAPCTELVMAASVASSGYRIVFDSDIKVEHHPGPRSEYSREDKNMYAFSFAYSMSIALRNRPRIARLGNALLGSRVAPGVLTAPLCIASGSSIARRWVSAHQGRAAARRDLKELCACKATGLLRDLHQLRVQIGS